MFCKLCTMYVKEKLEYTSQVWSLYLKKNEKLIENVKRKATKMVPVIRELNYSERLKAIDLHTMEKSRGIHDHNLRVCKPV